MNEWLYGDEVGGIRQTPLRVLDEKYKTMWRALPPYMNAKQRWSERYKLIRTVLKTKDVRRTLTMTQAITFWQDQQQKNGWSLDQMRSAIEKMERKGTLLPFIQSNGDKDAPTPPAKRKAKGPRPRTPGTLAATVGGGGGGGGAPQHGVSPQGAQQGLQAPRHMQGDGGAASPCAAPQQQRSGVQGLGADQPSGQLAHVTTALIAAAGGTSPGGGQPRLMPQPGPDSHATPRAPEAGVNGGGGGGGGAPQQQGSGVQGLGADQPSGQLAHVTTALIAAAGGTSPGGGQPRLMPQPEPDSEATPRTPAAGLGDGGGGGGGGGGVPQHGVRPQGAQQGLQAPRQVTMVPATPVAHPSRVSQGAAAFDGPTLLRLAQAVLLAQRGTAGAGGPDAQLMGATVQQAAMPKRPAHAFARFLAANAKKAAEYGAKDSREAPVVLSRVWNNMTTEAKQPYQDEYDRDLELYYQEKKSVKALNLPGAKRHRKK